MVLESASGELWQDAGPDLVSWSCPSSLICGLTPPHGRDSSLCQAFLHSFPSCPDIPKINTCLNANVVKVHTAFIHLIYWLLWDAGITLYTELVYSNLLILDKADKPSIHTKSVLILLCELLIYKRYSIMILPITCTSEDNMYCNCRLAVIPPRCIPLLCWLIINQQCCSYALSDPVLMVS